MRFSIRIYDIQGRDGFEHTVFTNRRPNYWDMMHICEEAGLENIIDFKDDTGYLFTHPVVRGKILRNRFNGMVPAGRFEIVHLTDDEIELEEVLR